MFQRYDSTPEHRASEVMELLGGESNAMTRKTESRYRATETA